MTEEKLKQIAFTCGWIEGRLQEDLDAVEEPEEKRHRQEMLDAFMIVSNAFDELRRQNADNEIKLTMLRLALQ